MLDQVPLSSSLRRWLAPVHVALERASGTPDIITTLGEYIACLRAYYRLFTKLEVALGAYPELVGGGRGFAPGPRARLLSADLMRLRAFQFERIVPMPPLSSFSEALGVRYVIEGSAVGGQVILAALSYQLVMQISGATSFFEGYGRAGLASWRAVKVGVDQYIAVNPKERQRVIDGAVLCYDMILHAAGEAVIGAPP